MRDGGAGGRRALAADHLGAAAPDVVHDDRHVAARTVEMRLDHLQRECGRDTGIESVAALFQRGHPDRGRDPVGRGHDAESAFDFRPCRERVGIDVAHGIPGVRGGEAGALDHSQGGLPTGAGQRRPPISVIMPVPPPHWAG